MPIETVPERRRTRYLRDQRLRELGYDTYAEYVNSPRWRLTRARWYRANPDPRCALCGAIERLILHHKTYERVGDEFLADLAAVCASCHDMVHVLERRGDAGLDIEGLSSKEARQRILDDYLQALPQLPFDERLEQLQVTAREAGEDVQRPLWLIRCLLRDGRDHVANGRLAALERRIHTKARARRDRGRRR